VQHGDGEMDINPDDDELHILVVVFSTWRQMANRSPPREGRKDATKPAHAVPLASARQHLDMETQAGHSSERAVEGPLECGITLGSQPGSCRLAGHQPNRTRAGIPPCLMAPAGPWELAFFSWRWDLFFARKREKKNLVFFGCFLVFFFVFRGCFCAFWCFFLFFTRSRAFFFWLFFPRGREQNREFPL